MASTDNGLLDQENAPIAQVIKQRRASIYTVNSDHKLAFHTDRDAVQRRMSRHSRQSSERSSHPTGETFTVPAVISNILDAENSPEIAGEVSESSRSHNSPQAPTYKVRYRHF